MTQLATCEPDKVLVDLEPQKEDNVLLVQGLEKFEDNQAFLESTDVTKCPYA